MTNTNQSPELAPGSMFRSPSEVHFYGEKASAGAVAADQSAASAEVESVPKTEHGHDQINAWRMAAGKQESTIRKLGGYARAADASVGEAPAGPQAVDIPREAGKLADLLDIHTDYIEDSRADRVAFDAKMTEIDNREPTRES